MKKKILYLRTDIYDKPVIAGGSVSHTLGVIKGMLDLGHSVACASSLMLEQLKSLNLAFLVPLKNPTFLKFLRWKINCLLSNIFFTVTVFKLYQKFKPDCLYQRYSILNFTGIILQKIFKIPLVLEYNGSEVWVEKQWSSRRKWFSLLRIVNAIELLNLRKALYVVVVSQALKDELIDRGIVESKILVNPNGVDADIFDPEILMRERELVRQQLNIQNKCVVGFVGTFSLWHGVNVLSEIIPLLLRESKSFHFLLIGDGPLLTLLKENLAKNNVEYAVTCTGIIPAQEARNYLSACDMYVCPTQPNPDGSRFFGSPTKLFEYLSLAKPTIASDLEQLQEIVNPTYFLPQEENILDSVGLLVEPTTESFCAAVLAVSKMSLDAQKKMGKNARERILKQYTWQCHVQKIMKFMES